MLQRQQGGYILTVEAGRSLLLSADARAESTLQTELMEIQERWRHAHHRLDQQKRELHSLLKVRQNLKYKFSFFTSLLVCCSLDLFLFKLNHDKITQIVVSLSTTCSMLRFMNLVHYTCCTL